MGNSDSKQGPSPFGGMVSSNPVMIFSATYCSYCNVVKRAFNQMGTKFSVVELNKHPEGPEIARELAEVTKERTVPQVFICGKWIGGCDNTRRLLASGQLQKMIEQCCDGDVTCSRQR